MKKALQMDAALTDYNETLGQATMLNDAVLEALKIIGQGVEMRDQEQVDSAVSVLALGERSDFTDQVRNS